MEEWRKHILVFTITGLHISNIINEWRLRQRSAYTLRTFYVPEPQVQAFDTQDPALNPQRRPASNVTPPPWCTCALWHPAKLRVFPYWTGLSRVSFRLQLISKNFREDKNSAKNLNESYSLSSLTNYFFGWCNIVFSVKFFSVKCFH